MIKRIFLGIYDLAYLLETVSRVFRECKRGSSISKLRVKSDKINVIMNGPSLRKDLAERMHVLKSNPVLCVNHIAFYDYYSELKPKYYVIADPKFWNIGNVNRDDTIVNDDAVKWQELANVLIERTNWKMVLYLPYIARENHNLIERLQVNQNIYICYYNTLAYRGIEKWRYWFYDRQYCVPQICNVLTASITLSLIMGYKEINLYGVDHSFFGMFEVDEKNQLIGKVDHVYQSNGEVYKLFRPDGSYLTVGEYLEDKVNIWNSYYDLERYASYRECKIINRTKRSFIDAFEKR